MLMAMFAMNATGNYLYKRHGTIVVEYMLFQDSWVAVKNREGMMPPLKANEWRSPCGRKQKNGGDLDGQDKKGCKKRGIGVIG